MEKMSLFYSFPTSSFPIADYTTHSYIAHLLFQTGASKDLPCSPCSSQPRENSTVVYISMRITHHASKAFVRHLNTGIIAKNLVCASTYTTLDIHKTNTQPPQPAVHGFYNIPAPQHPPKKIVNQDAMKTFISDYRNSQGQLLAGGDGVLQIHSLQLILNVDHDPAR